MNRKIPQAPSLDSSILFKLPHSMSSFDTMNPTLMPVVVEENIDKENFSVTTVSDVSILKTMSPSPTDTSTSNAPMILSDSVCQLNEPLFSTKTSPSGTTEEANQSPFEDKIQYKENNESQITCAPPLITVSANAIAPSVPFPQTYANAPQQDNVNPYFAPSDAFATNVNDNMHIQNFDQSQLFQNISMPISSSLQNLTNQQYKQSYSTLDMTNQYVPICHESGNASNDHTLNPSRQSSQQYNTEFNNHDTDTNEAIFIPVVPHWCYSEFVENKEIWYGFSDQDNRNLESSFLQGISIVHTDGNRYNANLASRKKTPVYYEGAELTIRRCTWYFLNSSTSKYEPFTEDTSNSIELHYQECFIMGEFIPKIFFVEHVGSFSFRSSQNMQYFPIGKQDISCPTINFESKVNISCPVKRGLPENVFLTANEPDQIDSLVFVVQGIGAYCDLRFRTVSQCVDGFREIANKLTESHFQKEFEQGLVGRIEFLPVAWHAKLHSSEFALDRKMKNVTLPSIPKLRHFTNDTLIDILLYSSPSYCQSIINTVIFELNRMYEIFLNRNPAFNGKIFVAGHSLGSLILFDILSNQGISYSESVTSSFGDEQDVSACKPFMEVDKESQSITSTKGSSQFLESDNRTRDENAKSFSYFSNTMKNGMSCIRFGQLKFNPAAFFALGSPISMFLAVRGYDKISEEFKFPTCPAFFHIFHPYDPVAFRIESMIDPNFKVKPVLIPHHKGRKRMHLEIRENVTRIASDLSQKVQDTYRYLKGLTKYSFSQSAIEAEVNNIVQNELPELNIQADESTDVNQFIGALNGGRRIDYVLQEKPIEALNDYVFALTSHATYWDSEDTVLMILKEIYSAQGIVFSTRDIENKSSSKSSMLSSISNEDTMISHPFLNIHIDNQMDQSYPSLNHLTNDQMMVSQPYAASANNAAFVTHKSQDNFSQQIAPPPLSGFVKRPLQH